MMFVCAIFKAAIFAPIQNTTFKIQLRNKELQINKNVNLIIYLKFKGCRIKAAQLKKTAQITNKI